MMMIALEGTNVDLPSVNQCLLTALRPVRTTHTHLAMEQHV